MWTLLKWVGLFGVLGLCVWVYLGWQNLTQEQRDDTKERVTQGVLGTPLSESMKEQAKKWMQDVLEKKPQ